MSNGRRGAGYERREAEHWRSHGYAAFRKPGSFGLFDVLAIEPRTGRVHVIEVKSGPHARLPRERRIALGDWAIDHGATAWYTHYNRTKRGQVERERIVA